MCFINEGDWTARVVEQDDNAVSNTEIKCGECRRAIPAGVPHISIYLQEHNEDDWDDWDDDGNPLNFDPGETFETNRCADCEKLLKAVEASEMEAGCHRSQARPCLEMLFEEISESRCGLRYRTKAQEMFPELEASGYLAEMLPEIE